MDVGVGVGNVITDDTGDGIGRNERRAGSVSDRSGATNRNLNISMRTIDVIA